MGKKRVVEQWEIDRICSLAGTGIIPKVIATIMDMHPTTVWKYLHLNGIKWAGQKYRGEIYSGDKTCPCGKQAVDRFRDKPICASCMNPEQTPAQVYWERQSAMFRSGALGQRVVECTETDNGLAKGVL